MKSFVAVILALGSVSALGSGPYLPSGWRPQGPAFYLPGEKPADSPLKETILFESEASGSDALREYGPPKVSENVINQGLPDVATETTFYVEKAAEAVVEENVEEKSEVVAEATTEAQLAAEEPTVVYARIADIELQTDVTPVSYNDEVKEVEATVSAVEEKLEEVVQTTEQFVEAKEETEEKLEQVVAEVEVAQEGVKNIAEALTNLENEIKAEQAQSEVVSEVKVQEGSGSAQAPEGFLEYGPPGFREYGPPKGDVLRTAAVIQEPSNSVTSDNNDARRRRFSPKFRASKNKKIH